MKSSLRCKKRHRVKKPAEFKYIYQNGMKISGSFHTAFFIPSRNSESRIGISVPRRVGNAVVRNYHKRVVREWFRHARPEFAVAWDVVVVLHRRPPHRQLLFQDLTGIFTWLKSFNISSALS